MSKPIIYRAFASVDHMKTVIKLNSKEYHGYWVKGSYMQHINRMPSPVGDSIKESDIDHFILYSGSADWNMPRQVCFEKVLPETVCRRVMVSEKLGEIFEHDIIKFRSFNKLGKFTTMIGEVLFDDHRNTIMIKIGRARPQSILLNDNLLVSVLGNTFENSLEEFNFHAENTQITKAVIISEHFENERGLTHFVSLTTEDGQYISFGGLHLIGDACYNWMYKFIEVVGKGSTAHCEGVHVLVKIEDGDVVAIGSINYDLWLDKRDFLSKE